jgi:DNA-binding NtrC family response regulator
VITTAKNTRRLETVKRNGGAAAPEEARQSQALREQAEALKRLAQDINQAVEGLVATADVLELANATHVEIGIDFYEEVERYEVLLIKRALRHSEGSQVKAAALLKLSPTTLNSKIKHLAIRTAKSNNRAARLSLLP